MLRIFTCKNIIALCFCFSSLLIVSAQNGQMLFVSHLLGNNQIPAVTSNGQGILTFLVSEDLSEIEIHGVFDQLSSNLSGIHIHTGDFISNGPVLVDLMSGVSGKRIKIKIPTPANFISLAQLGRLYVNIHTVMHPNGEIRGQLDWRAELLFPLLLLGSNQVPPVTSNALGLGVLRVSPTFSRIDYQILVTGLSGPTTAAHIHSGDANSNGPVLVGLNVGGMSSGSITDPAIVSSILTNTFSAGAYVNVHTDTNPGGEIRSQISISNPLSASAVLNGDQETPAVVTSARGFGFAYLNYPTMDSITYFVIAEGLTPTAAHIHNAKAGQSGGVVIGLTPIAFPGTAVYTGKGGITLAQRTAFLKDELYFNIHTATNPGGEIRGQLENNLLNAFAFDLCGEQEVPVKNITAHGASHVAINKANTELEYSSMAVDLSGPATAAHIHQAAFGTNGPVLIGLNPTGELTFGVRSVTGIEAAQILAGNTYVNLHTAANASGEIRGQIRKGLSCNINTSTFYSEIQTLHLLQNPIVDELVFEMEISKTQHLNAIITNMDGKENLVYPLQVHAGNSQYRINTSTLESGMYFLLLNQGKQKFAAVKFVKQ